MKQEVVRELSTNEIRERLEEEKKQLTKLKLNHAVSPLENPNKIKAYRKTIARLVTELRKRQIADTLSANAVTNKSSLK
jgi:large subunit ribosomal protein L29